MNVVVAGMLIISWVRTGGMNRRSVELVRSLCWSNRQQSVSSCFRIVFPCIVVGVGLLSSKFWVVELLLAGCRGMRLFIAVVPVPPFPLDPLLRFLLSDSPAASVCAVLFFVVS